MPRAKFVYCIETQGGDHCHISHSTDPWIRVLHHNILGAPKYKGVKPHSIWNLCMVVGNFYEGGASAFSRFLAEHKALDPFVLALCLIAGSDQEDRLYVAVNDAKLKCNQALRILRSDRLLTPYAQAVQRFRSG